ncbi:ribokinase [Acetobacter estunensis]|uniref:ribokinase n=1 Tax=Acetobacter estunensis TaxID=104097 RepID=UPI001C2DD54A|nr:ribokinase [Acetobacter estunensis]MBV1836696.1 ribokinase [Acetobacter estunensis]
MEQHFPLILVIGSVNIDITARGAHLPAPGETVHAQSYTIGLGGKGANQAAAAARLGTGAHHRVAFAGRTGTDDFAKQARSYLTAFDLDLTALASDKQHPTGLALIGVDQKGENSITVIGGANMALDHTDVDRLQPMLEQARVVLLQLEIPLDVVEYAARCARASGCKIILDPAPAPSRPLPSSLLSLVDVLTPNETETQALTGLYPQDEATAEQASQELMRQGAQAVTIKMGGQGVWWQTPMAGGFVPAFAVSAIDTVAAGDCFNAGLATGLIQERSLQDATRLAAACGALATTKEGAAESAPEWEDVLRLMEKQNN